MDAASRCADAALEASQTALEQLVERLVKRVFEIPYSSLNRKCSLLTVAACEVGD